jgi:addiction module RelB/DinJ family antitoxin
MSNTTVQARISPELKSDAETILSAIGLSTADAIRVFLQQVVNHNGLPFPLTNEQPGAAPAAPLVDRANSQDVNTAFEQNVAAFERMLPELRRRYLGQFVAVYGGAVIAHGDDELDLLRTVRQQYGPVACYVEQVADDLPRQARFTSTWVTG